MTYDVKICMQAKTMFNGGGKLEDEIKYVLEERTGEELIDFTSAGGLSEDDSLKLNQLDTDLIMKHLKFNPDRLIVDDYDWDNDDLNIYYIIPVEIDVDSLLKYIY